MIKYIYTLSLFIFYTITTSACLNTYQFKIFPVGIIDSKITTVDVQIMRTSQYEGNYILNPNMNYDEHNDWTISESEMWILYSYISVYDKNQKLLSSTPFDTTYSIGHNYIDSLQSTFNAAYTKIINDNHDIELFVLEYISFCDFQKKCNNLETLYDSTSNTNYIIYQNKKHKIDIINDTSYYAFGSNHYNPETLEWLYINSIRTFKTKDTELIITHLITGHELSMGWLTNDPEIAKNSENEIIRLLKEYKPDLKFSDIKKSVYEEPILHHAYGFDIFILKNNKQ